MHAQDPAPFSLDPNNPEDAELIGFFVDELPARVDTLRTAAENEDLDSIKRLAHQLKGAAPSYGFPTIGQAAAQLEDCLKDTGINSLVQIKAELDALIGLCDSYAKGS
ncbi:MAG: Hpt domain-containing protein [Phycisphaerales bacterium]|nr:Hpt domain-containing protein [Phycisphaerales bacterium]